MLDLRCLKSLVVLVEERHYRRAAERLRVTQPALSRRIQALEQMVGAALVVRSERLVRLTEAGERLVQQAHRILEQVEAARDEAMRAGRGELGRLRLGFTSMAFFRETPEIVGRYRALYPGVEIRLRELISIEQERALLAHEIDVGFLHPPIEEGGLSCHALPDEELVLVLPADHPQAALPRVPMGALSEDRFILFPRAVGPNLWDRVMVLCRRAGFSPHIVQEVVPMTSVIGLVAAGAGVGLVTRCLAVIQRANVVYRSIEGEAPTLPFAVAWHDPTLSPTAATFLSLIRSEARAAPP